MPQLSRQSDAGARFGGHCGSWTPASSIRSGRPTVSELVHEGKHYPPKSCRRLGLSLSNRPGACCHEEFSGGASPGSGETFVLRKTRVHGRQKSEGGGPEVEDETHQESNGRSTKVGLIASDYFTIAEKELVGKSFRKDTTTRKASSQSMRQSVDDSIEVHRTRTLERARRPGAPVRRRIKHEETTSRCWPRKSNRSSTGFGLPSNSCRLHRPESGRRPRSWTNLTGTMLKTRRQIASQRTEEALAFRRVVESTSQNATPTSTSSVMLRREFTVQLWSSTVATSSAR